MPEEVQQPVPQPTPQTQITTPTPKAHNWKKVILTIVFIVGVVAVVTGIYWFMVVNKDSDNPVLKVPVQKETTKTSTESVEATESTEKDGWEIYTDTTFNYSIKYPKDWLVVKGGGRACSSLVRGRSEDNICFQSLDFAGEETTGMGITVEGWPYSTNKLTKCSASAYLKECEELKIAEQDALKQLIRSSQIKGTLHVDELYSFPGKNNESDIRLTFTYFRCQDDGNNDCTNKDEADKFIEEVLSSFKFLD